MAQDFSVLGNGNLSDRTVERSVGQLRKELPKFDELATEAHLIFSRAHAVYLAVLSARYEELGLSVPRMNLLWWLHNAEEAPLTISELSAHLEASLPSVMRLVRVLEEDGWLNSWVSETDRRVTLVKLTEDGKSRFAGVLQRATGIWSDLWSGLDQEEKAILGQLLAKVRFSLLTRFIGHESLLPYKMQAQQTRRGYSPRTAE